MRTEEPAQAEPILPASQNPSMILFYDDVTVFGGHEKMACSLIDQFFRFTNHRIVFILSEENFRLQKELESLRERYSERLSLVPVRFRSGAMPTLEMIWQLPQLLSLVRLFKRLNPAFAVIVQGNIELSVKGLVAARLAGVPTASYLPYVLRFRDIPEIPLATVRDLCNTLLYRIPHQFMVIADEYRKALVEKFVVPAAAVHLIRNLLDTSQLHHHSKNDARAQLGLPDTGLVIAVIGRIYFKQKGQDVAIEGLSSLLGSSIRLIFVGEGPDRQQLVQMCAHQISEGSVVVKEWLENPSLAYCAADMILMPSLLEGVPLVLLEALYYGKMVVASDIPPFNDYLPPSQRFSPAGPDALRECVMRAVAHLGAEAVDLPLSASVTNQSDINRQSILNLVQAMDRRNGGRHSHVNSW